MAIPQWMCVGKTVLCVNWILEVLYIIGLGKIALPYFVYACKNYNNNVLYCHLKGINVKMYIIEPVMQQACLNSWIVVGTIENLESGIHH